MQVRHGAALVGHCMSVVTGMITGCQSSSGATGQPGPQPNENSSSEPLPPARVTYEINSAMSPPGIPATVVSVGQTRPVGVMVGPDGMAEGYVVDEVMLRAETEDELNDFLARYNGTVLSDGTLPFLPDQLRVKALPHDGWYLVRVDLAQSSLDDLPPNMEAAGVDGHLVFSSDDAARLAALVARDAPAGAWPNLLMYSLAIPEQPDYGGGNLDASTFAWMTEDNSPFTPGDQGLSVGVIHAWDYLAYKNIPPTPPPGGSVFWEPVRVALIDVGFALDETTGVPLLGNVDYFNSFNAPLQLDVANGDARAGGASDVSVDGGGSSAWHGQGAFGVCCAAERNQVGGAGVAGPVAQPILVRTGGTLYSMADAVHAAGNMGADVINISMGGECGTLCHTADIFWDNRIEDSVEAVTDVGAIVVAGAGNNGYDLDDHTYLPCEVFRVMCVGSVQRSTTTRHNFGTNVAISAPEDVLSTLTPDSVAFDADDLGPDELHSFTGTSCATAFASGVVALLKAADPALRWDDVPGILQATANPSTDARVPHGYVDAFRAVASMLPNTAPTIQIALPHNGDSVSYAGVFVHVDVHDPESPGLFRGTVEFSSSADGNFCQPIGGGDDFGCSAFLSVGTHDIVARATDPFGAFATDSIKIFVINNTPAPFITDPADGSSFFTSQTINFRGYGFDVEDEISTNGAMTWESSIDGPLGNGPSIFTQLSAGAHTVTLTAADTLGATGQDSVVVHVIVGTGYPSARILTPDTDSYFGPGATVTLTGEGTDNEDGALTGTSLSWSSDVDGFLGTGTSLNVVLSGPPSPCNPEYVDHVITLTVTDSSGRQSTHQVRIHVGSFC